jgi:hypothetical protein
MQYLLEEAGANMEGGRRQQPWKAEGVNNHGSTVSDMLIRCLERDVTRMRDWFLRSLKEDDPLTLAGVLRVLVLCGALPPALVALLSPEPAHVVQEGVRLRARLPTYLVRRRALLNAHCPLLLLPLRALVHGYMELTTTEEVWATGLGTEP